MVGTPSVPTPSGAARRAGAVKNAEGTAERRTPWRASLTAPSTVAPHVVHTTARTTIGESIGLTIGSICARPSARAGRDQVLVPGATKCSWISSVFPSLRTVKRHSARRDSRSDRRAGVVQQQPFIRLLHLGVGIDRQDPAQGLAELPPEVPLPREALPELVA